MTDSHRIAIRDLLSQAGHNYACGSVVDAEIGDGSIAELRRLLHQALKSADLPLAGATAEVLAAAAWGSEYYLRAFVDSRLDIPVSPPDASLSASKLRHDSQQLCYLASKG